MRQGDGAGMGRMEPGLKRWPRARRSCLPATLAAVLLLIPAASASAEIDTHIVFEGEGSGWVKGARSTEDGKPPIKCHWNGTEIDLGTGINPGTGEGESGTPAQAGKCETEAEGSGGIFGIGVIHEADKASKFAGWEVLEGFDGLGCFDELAKECTVVFPPIEIKAAFEPDPDVPLTINPVGSGAGQVNCDVNEGERLDAPCAAEYEPGIELELIAAPGPNSEFAGFENGSGDAEGCATSPCGPFTLEEESELDARFELIERTLTVEAIGEGSVSANSGAISGCEEAAGTCSGTYGQGTTVTLTATPAAGKAALWTGCTPVGGQPNKCNIQIPAGDALVKAEFVAENPVPTLITEAPAANTGTRATLAGTVNPRGLAVDDCFFEWGEDVSGGLDYTETVPCAETPATIGAGTSPVAVHADIVGLDPQGGKYEYRLVAVNANGTANGANRTFVTPNTVFTEPGTGLTPTGATLNGTVNPDTAAISECAFEWGPLKAPDEELQKFPELAPCVPGPGGIVGEGAVAVEAAISGLAVGAVYAYRLKVAYPGKTVNTERTTLQTLGPLIAGTWPEDVTYTEATLKAEVNPTGKATSYRFEWGPTEAYGSESEELAVGSDSSGHEFSHFLSGLEPGTTYHFRVVATNADATNVGPDTTFTTYEPLAPDTDCPNQLLRYVPSAKLPDCRAYEMVSPVDKAGKGIVPGALGGDNTAIRMTTANGEKLTYTSGYSFGDSRSAKLINQYLATRTVNGWSTHGINPPQGTTIFDPGYDGVDFTRSFLAFTSDLSTAWVRDYSQVPLAPGGREGFRNLYRRDNLAETYEPLTTIDPLFGSADYLPDVRGFSDDGSRVFLNVDRPLTADAALNTNDQLYEHSGGRLELVSVLPGGGADPDDSALGDGAVAAHSGPLNDAVSSDGSRVFWTSGADGKPSGQSRFSVGKIFVRIDGERTVPVSGSVNGDTAQFWTASADGSKALFSFESAFQAPPTALENNLYEFDVDTETSTLIAGGVEGVAAAAADLSRVYFVSRDALASGAVAGEENLYLYEDGAPELIAVTGGNLTAGSKAIVHTASATPDGSHLVFMSDRSLTGYESADQDSGEFLDQVFLYDAEKDELRCLSCNSSGARPSGGGIADTLHGSLGSLLKISEVAAWIPTWENALHKLRPISTDGDRVFFNSFDALVPHDTNGLQDVYQWEEPGTGSCDVGDPEFSELNEGCVSLISTGQSPKPSEFTEASQDGSSAFFETESSIHSEDSGLNDIYVARVGGGFLRPSSPIPCVGDACQSVPPAPDDPTPASAGFRGAGDPPPGRSCRPAARRAVKLRRRAKRMRSGHLAKRARRISRRAKHCRRANRRARR